jgi:predicted nucleic acid-binding protein
VSIVVDANVVVSLVTTSPRQAAASAWLDRWHAEAEDLHVPQLFTYEVASALAGMEAGKQITTAASGQVWNLVEALQLTLHPPSSGATLVSIARRLRRSSAHDAAYVDLAMQLQAELWTLDVKLARNAESLGYPVRLMV